MFFCKKSEVFYAYFTKKSEVLIKVLYLKEDHFMIFIK